MSALHTLSVLVEDRRGVLARVAGLFAARGFNIHSLAVGTTEEPGYSRMTIVVDVEPERLEQVGKQLNKLINVIKVQEPGQAEAVGGEAPVIKGGGQGDARGPGIEVAGHLRGPRLD